MSLASLMTQTVSLIRTTSLQRDDIGGTVAVTSNVDVLGYLEPTKGSEDLADRNTGVGTWLLILPASVDVTNWDAVDYDTRRFEIVAPPRPMFNPSTKVVSHYELDLEEVQA